MGWKEGFGNRGFLRFVAVSLVAAAVAVGLYACKKTDEEGVVAIGLTDAPGDFLTYTVDVTSLRSEEHTSELQSPMYLVCRLLLEKKKKTTDYPRSPR